MHILNAGFSEKEKRIVLHRYFSDDRIRAFDLKLTKAVHKVCSVVPMLGQSWRGALQTIRSHLHTRQVKGTGYCTDRTRLKGQFPAPDLQCIRSISVSCLKSIPKAC
ncbi:hypothetical protein KC19_VG066600 [Ceratodon purpureus]|uniref:Uncharacterized protein n=1 Tax=Ceratodon purpureus TaxID=3225 RepID=A0A8T0HMQ3_CERPU|nr:hypothetical protein KC19_VG066600 [Ceratodon purpureus]